MKIEFAFDDEVPQVMFITFKNGWTWADFHAVNDAVIAYPPNVAIPAGVRVDQMVDLRESLTLPDDGIGAINVKRSNVKLADSSHDIPRNGGITVYVGNVVFISAMLRTFNVLLDKSTAKKIIFPTIALARQAILDNRAHSANG